MEWSLANDPTWKCPPRCVSTVFASWWGWRSLWIFPILNCTIVKGWEGLRCNFGKPDILTKQFLSHVITHQTPWDVALRKEPPAINSCQIMSLAWGLKRRDLEASGQIGLSQLVNVALLFLCIHLAKGHVQHLPRVRKLEILGLGIHSFGNAPACKKKLVQVLRKVMNITSASFTKTSMMERVSHDFTRKTENNQDLFSRAFLACKELWRV